MGALSGHVGAIYIRRQHALLIDANGEYAAQSEDKAAMDFLAASSFSLELWLRPAASADGVVLEKFDSNTGYQLSIASNKLVFKIGDGTNTPSITGDTSVNTGTWYHIVLVRSVGNDNLCLYINGSSDATPVSDTTTASLANAGIFTVGKSTGGSRFAIGEIKVWNKGLSSTEVSALYNSGNTKMADRDDCVALYHLLEGKGTTIKNHSANTGLNLTITNATWVSHNVTVTGEAVGTGDDETVAFALDYPNVDNVVVYFDAVAQSKSMYSVTPKGTLVFFTAPTSGVAITADYTYSPIAQVGGFFSWSLDYNASVHDCTDFLSNGARTYIPGLTTWAASATRHWIFPGHVVNLNERFIIKLYYKTSGSDRYEGWAILKGIRPAVPTDGIVDESFDFQGSELLGIEN